MNNLKTFEQFINEDNSVNEAKVKVGDILYKAGRKGKVVKVMSDMVNVDFGGGDVYGIMLRRIKGDQIKESVVNEGSLPKKGTMVKLQPSINLISLIDIKDQDLEVIGYKKTGLISGPSEFLIVKDAKGKKHEINPEYIEESVTEGKMPKKYIGNDEIVYLKSKEDSKGAHYNLYYKGHDIDTGGRRFGSEKELKDFADDYILSNQLYNKLRYKDSKPLPESLDETTQQLDVFHDRLPQTPHVGLKILYTEGPYKKPKVWTVTKVGKGTWGEYFEYKTEDGKKDKELTSIYRLGLDNGKYSPIKK